MGGVFAWEAPMMAECFGGPWDGERIPLQGRVVVTSVLRPAFLADASSVDERYGCYVLTSRGYDWEADE